MPNWSSVISQDKIGKQGSVSEYNANNAWMFNGNNGCVNNNNKYNVNGVRPVHDSHIALENPESVLVPLHEWYSIYRVCKRHSGNKRLHLLFRYGNLSKRIVDICTDVSHFEYVPQMSICFMIEVPRLREVIAAVFDDKMVQTFYCETVIPLLERHFLHPDSYACRKGKGGLRAVLQLQEYIYDDSRGYTRDVWLAKIDLKGFFMSIDTELGVRLLCDFINARMEDGPRKQLVLYLTRIIYQSMPQMHCIMQATRELHESLPEYKRMKGRCGFKGVAIGNPTSQMMGAFLTTYYLILLQELDYHFVHYTDDTALVVTELERWLLERNLIGSYLHDELRLTLHPDKLYLQHYSKGVEMLGYKVRFNRLLPSDRIVHNFTWKLECMSRKAKASRSYMFANIENYMQTVNSYMGLLSWCNSYRIRSRIMDGIRNSVFGKCFDFSDDNRKITIKPSYTMLAHYKRKNAERKKALRKSEFWRSL